MLFRKNKITWIHPTAPAHYSVEDAAGHHQGVKCLWYGSTDIEGSQSAEKKQVALTFLIQSLRIFRPVQLILYVNTCNAQQCPPLYT